MLCEKYNLQSERTFETPCKKRTLRVLFTTHLIILQDILLIPLLYVL